MSFKIDFQVSGTSPLFTAELRKSSTVITGITISEPNVTNTFSNLDYDVTDYNILVTDQCGNETQHNFDTIRPLDFGDFNADVWAIRMLSNGKYVMGGKFTTYTLSGVTTQSQRLIILNGDGTVYKAFTEGFTGGLNNSTPPNIIETGATEQATAYTIITDILIDEANEKMIVVGNYTFYNDVEYRGIVKIGFDGTVDSTFSVVGSSGGISGDAYAGTHNAIQFIEVVDDDNILIGGQFSHYRSQLTNDIALINKTTGVRNTAFTSPFAPTKSYRCACYYNGYVYLGGEFIVSYDSMSFNNFISLNVSDGSLNTTFHGGGSTFGFIANAGVSSVYKIKQWNEKIIIGGAFSNYFRNDLSFVSQMLTRLNLDGTPDTTFNNGGGYNYGMTYSSDYWLVRDIYIDKNNKAYICGEFNNYNQNNILCLIRILDSGSLDSTYLGNKVCLYKPTDVVCRSISDVGVNKIIVGGAFTQYTDPVTSEVKLSDNIILLYDNGQIYK